MPRPSVAFEAIGTRWQIDTDLPLDRSVLGSVHARIEAFDLVWSRFRADSLVTRMATEAGTYRLPADAGPLLDLYALLGRLTGGAVSPLVGRSMERLGYDRDYSLRASTPLPAPRWEDTVQRDGEHLVVRTPTLIDVGAAGKGHLVDLVAAELREAGVDEYVVDAGGDLVHRGGDRLRVALEHPGDPSKAIGVALVDDGAICGSGINRRAWGDGLHHVIDARTGAPTREVVATWVLADSALVADGVATALFFAGADRLAGELDFRYLVVHADGSARYSPDLPCELFR